MFLSIVIPIWNDEKYLNECLDSCLNQELSKDEYEIICVDDGSTDRTPEILREYAEKHSNIVIITKQHGTQYGYGRDIGLAAAHGDYVWFVDHDDFIAPDAVDQLLKLALDNSEYDRIAFPCYEFYDALTEDESVLVKSGELRSNTSLSSVFQDYMTWSSIIKISFLKERDIFPHSKRIVASAAFWEIDDYRIWSGDTIFLDECLDKGIKTLRISGRPLYHYRRHENTETMSTDPAMVQRRMSAKLNTGLLWAYLAYQQKLIYDEERTLHGKATPETAEKAIEQVKRAVSYLSALPSRQWRQGFQRLKEKKIFFSNIPEEYSLRFSQYWKWCTWKERLLPSTIACYFIFTECGAFWYRFFTWPFRFREKISIWKKYRTQKRQKRLIAIGTGKSSY